MLSQLRTNQIKDSIPRQCAPSVDNRWERNMQDDMKEAIDLTFKFKDALDKLHPECISIIERMISLSPRNF